MGGDKPYVDNQQVHHVVLDFLEIWHIGSGQYFGHNKCCFIAIGLTGLIVIEA